MKKEVKDLLSKLSLEQKVSLLSGKDFWHLEGFPELDIPSIMVTDGPHGLRKQSGDSDHIGLAASVNATCYPTAVGLASTWDTDLVHKVGEYLATECIVEDVAVILGPGANIKRHPLCGRNFEYFSEDPLLTGKLASGLINGVQSKGVGTSIKHYVANNQESMRMAVDTLVDDRTMREMYLKGFEIAVKESQPWTVMCSYNKVNGTYLSEHKELLQDILKDEWKHEGLVVTDWGATNDRLDGLIAGQELEMPSSGGNGDPSIIAAVKNGTLSEELLDERVGRVLDLILKSKPALENKNEVFDVEKHHQFARKVAADTIVLLKNDDNMLPLCKDEKIGLIGEFAKTPRYQGSGSSLINPPKITCAFDAMQSLIGENVLYAQGYYSKDDIIDDALIKEAVEVAKKVDKVVLMIGLTDQFESEGFDRTHLCIPNNHTALLEAVLKVNKNVVVALSNGSPVEMTWKDNVKAIVEQYLGGQASGEALVDVLYGDVNPSGKLAETFPNNVDEFPSNQNFPGKPRQVQYREGLYVGYRFYDTANVTPLYPFGYGLSYTTFNLSNFVVKKNKSNITVSVDVTNTGEVSGKEVVQVYVSKDKSVIYRPAKELKGFSKVELKPGETKTVSISIPVSELSVYNDNAFVLEGGAYEVLIGTSSKDILHKETIKLSSKSTLKGDMLDEYKNITPSFTISEEAFVKLYGKNVPEYPAVRPYHLNTVISETENTFIGKRLKKVLVGQFSKMVGEDVDEKILLMMEAVVGEMPYRNLSRLSGGKISDNRLQGIIDLMNRKIFRGLWKVIRG